MRTWLKLIGCHKRPITDDPFCGKYPFDYVGFRKERKPGIRMGDRLFLYAPGGSKRIFAVADVVGDPERDIDYDPKKEGSCRWKVRIEYLINLSVASGIHIDDVGTSQRNLAASIRQQSHIELFPEEYDDAFEKLRKKCDLPAKKQ